MICPRVIRRDLSQGYVPGYVVGITPGDMLHGNRYIPGICWSQGFVAVICPRVIRRDVSQGYFPGLSCRDMSLGYVAGICCRDMFQGYVSGKTILCEVKMCTAVKLVLATESIVESTTRLLCVCALGKMAKTLVSAYCQRFLTYASAFVESFLIL